MKLIPWGAGGFGATGKGGGEGADFIYVTSNRSVGWEKCVNKFLYFQIRSDRMVQ